MIDRETYEKRKKVLVGRGWVIHPRRFGDSAIDPFTGEVVPMREAFRRQEEWEPGSLWASSS